MNSFFRQKTVVITGASAGIGLATALEFARRGARVFLIARDRERLAAAARQVLEQTGQPAGGVFSADVGDRGAIEKTIAGIAAQTGGIDALVLNAGINRCGYFGDIPVETFEEVLRTNYLGALYALKAAWPHLIRSGDSRVGLVSSVAGYTGLIGYTTYAPAKFALTGLAEAVRMEGRRHGLKTTVIFPPDTDTAMYRYEQQHAVPEAKALSKSAGVITPERVARRLVAAMEQGKFEVVLNGEGRLIKVLKGLWPGLYYFMVDRIAFSKT